MFTAPVIRFEGGGIFQESSYLPALTGIVCADNNTDTYHTDNEADAGIMPASAFVLCCDGITFRAQAEHSRLMGLRRTSQNISLGRPDNVIFWFSMNILNN